MRPTARTLLLLGALLTLLPALAGRAEAQRGGQQNGGRGGRGGGFGRGGFGASSPRLGGTRSRVRTRKAPGKPMGGPGEKEPLKVLGKLYGSKRDEERSDVGPTAGLPGPAGPRTGRAVLFDLASENQLNEWFLVVDHNANGWLGWRETERSLGFDRARFLGFDQDKDGRLDLAEFGDHYRYSIAQYGHFREPKPYTLTLGPPDRDAEQLRVAYDRNADGELDEAELVPMLDDYQRFDLEADRLVVSLDEDGNGRLSVDELRQLAGNLSPLAVDPRDAEREVASIEDLFGIVVERPGAERSVHPPQILGPVTLFRRLDLDDDGLVTQQDLDTLLRPAYTSVRTRTVLATLDTNGDGALDRRELRAALTAPGSGYGDD